MQKNTVQTIKNTVNKSIHITNTPTQSQNKLKQPQYKTYPNERVTL